MALSPQTLSLDDRRRVAAWAADCAEQVLPIFETAAPGDARVREAIGQARAFAAGDLGVVEAIRRRGGAAGGAARDAPTDAARAAAYAAEQAAACAHMGAHALGAAGYAAKALALAADDDHRDDAVRSAWLRAIAESDDAVAAALASLPALGESASGPLARGRLSGGHVGQAIRAIQAELRARSFRRSRQPAEVRLDVDDTLLARRALFGDDVAAYEHGRPPYPARVFELLSSVGALRAGCRVLEVGPGTGQATVALLDAGAHVTAVELSDAFADRLADRFAGRAFTVVRGPFESADLDAASFDLAVAATSFHWIVPTADGLARCADVLRPGGRLALWWNVFGDATRPDPFADALDALLLDVEPALADQPERAAPAGSILPYARDVEARVAEIDATGRFDPVRHEVIAWTGRHTTDEALALFASFSPWLALPRARRAAALDHLERLANERFGGVVTRPYQTPVYLARRR